MPPSWRIIDKPQGRAGRDGHVGRVKKGVPGKRRVGQVGRDGRVFERVVDFISKYMSMPERLKMVVSAWVIAAWLSDVWDRFPHLAVMSPQKRCGKTRLLQILSFICPNAYHTPNGSPAAIYRLIELEHPTFLLDEAQSITRRGSESSEVIREFFNAGIDRNAVVLRCVSKEHSVQKFSIYCPKIFALIGDLDGVLADRCLPVSLTRKTDSEPVEQYRSRLVEPLATELHDEINEWAESHRDRVQTIYDKLQPFDIANDRMAELLLPLQAILTAMKAGEAIEELQEYAVALDDAAEDKLPPDLVLLAACREIFGKQPFLKTRELIAALCTREEEPWGTFTRGEPITPEKLSNFFAPYGIEPEHSKDKKSRGYARQSFVDAWTRYLPKIPSDSSNPSKASGGGK